MFCDKERMKTMKIIPYIQIGLGLSGILFMWLSWRQRTEHFKGFSFKNPAFKISYYKNWFTPLGYKFYLLGIFCMSGSGLVAFVYFSF